MIRIPYPCSPCIPWLKYSSRKLIRGHRASQVSTSSMKMALSVPQYGVMFF